MPELASSSEGNLGYYIAIQDNTRVSPDYLARGGNPVGYTQNGGLIFTGDSDWEPMEHARYVDGRAIDMSYTSSVQGNLVGWALGGLMRLTCPSTDLSTVLNGDTVIWMDGGYNGHPVMSIIKISNEDTTFTNNYHYPSNELIYKYGD